MGGQVVIVKVVRMKGQRFDLGGGTWPLGHEYKTQNYRKVLVWCKNGTFFYITQRKKIFYNKLFFRYLREQPALAIKSLLLQWVNDNLFNFFVIKRSPQYVKTLPIILFHSSQNVENWTTRERKIFFWGIRRKLLPKGLFTLLLFLRASAVGCVTAEIGNFLSPCQNATICHKNRHLCHSQLQIRSRMRLVWTNLNV